MERLLYKSQRDSGSRSRANEMDPIIQRSGSMVQTPSTLWTTPIRACPCCPTAGSVGHRHAAHQPQSPIGLCPRSSNDSAVLAARDCSRGFAGRVRTILLGVLIPGHVVLPPFPDASCRGLLDTIVPPSPGGMEPLARKIPARDGIVCSGISCICGHA